MIYLLPRVRMKWKIFELLLDAMVQVVMNTPQVLLWVTLDAILQILIYKDWEGEEEFNID